MLTGYSIHLTIYPIDVDIPFIQLGKKTMVIPGNLIKKSQKQSASHEIPWWNPTKTLWGIHWIPPEFPSPSAPSPWALPSACHRPRATLRCHWRPPRRRRRPCHEYFLGFNRFNMVQQPKLIGSEFNGPNLCPTNCFRSKNALMIVIITRIFDNRHHYSDHLQCHKTSLVRQESIEGIGQNQPEMGM